MSHSLDQSTILTPRGSGRYQLVPSDNYWNMVGAFGGWSISAAVRAVLLDENMRGEVVSVNAIFPSGFSRDPLDVTVISLCKRGRTDFWRITFTAADDPELIFFSADIVTTETRETDITNDAPLPDVPQPEDMARTDLSLGPKWQQHYDQRLIKGRPFKAAERAYTLNWLREADGRPLDATGLAAISDTYMPRTFFLANEMRMGATVSYSLNLYATAAELAAIGSDFILLEGDSDCVRDGKYDQRGKMWSRDGKVLAITNQIGFFK